MSVCRCHYGVSIALGSEPGSEPHVYLLRRTHCPGPVVALLAKDCLGVKRKCIPGIPTCATYNNLPRYSRLFFIYSRVYHSLFQVVGYRLNAPALTL